MPRRRPSRVRRAVAIADAAPRRVPGRWVGRRTIIGPGPSRHRPPTAAAAAVIPDDGEDRATPLSATADAAAVTAISPRALLYFTFLFITFPSVSCSAALLGIQPVRTAVFPRSAWPPDYGNSQMHAITFCTDNNGSDAGIITLGYRREKI